MLHGSRFMRLGAIAASVLIACALGCGNEENGGDDLQLPPPHVFLVNELMAVNHTTISDPADTAFDDWLELWNPGPDTGSTVGLYLTDDFTLPFRFELPDTTIPPGGHLLLWLDNEPAQGRWHVPFRLNGTGGEQAGLFGRATSGAVVIDTVSFGPQKPDTSYARMPDGGAWTLDPTPTPGAANTP
jgi:large repetitive protein